METTGDLSAAPGPNDQILFPLCLLLRKDPTLRKEREGWGTRRGVAGIVIKTRPWLT
jgi:hypothetical protein